MLTLGTLFIAVGMAAAETGTAKQNILVIVDEDGYHNKENKPVSEIKVTKGETIKLTFRYNGEEFDLEKDPVVHQFAVWSPVTKKKKISDALSRIAQNPEASIEFVAGENGESYYYVVCEISCYGMKNLTGEKKLKIVVLN